MARQEVLGRGEGALEGEVFKGSRQRGPDVPENESFPAGLCVPVGTCPPRGIRGFQGEIA